MAAVSWYKLVVWRRISAKRRAYFRKSIAIKTGGVSRYFSEVSGPGVDLTLLKLVTLSRRLVADQSPMVADWSLWFVAANRYWVAKSLAPLRAGEKPRKQQNRAKVQQKYRKSYQNKIRNAWIAILIPLEYVDVMHMKSLRKLIPPEFSDVMIT